LNKRCFRLPPEDPISVKQSVEVLILCFYCNCVCISIRDLSSSTLLAVLVTYLHTYNQKYIYTIVLWKTSRNRNTAITLSGLATQYHNPCNFAYNNYFYDNNYNLNNNNNNNNYYTLFDSQHAANKDTTFTLSIYINDFATWLLHVRWSDMQNLFK